MHISPCKKICNAFVWVNIVNYQSKKHDILTSTAPRSVSCFLD